MAEQLIPYALKDGRFVSVEDVDRGKTCGCICPICKQHLQARKGEVRQKHFAHIGGAETCKGQYEATIHGLAIQILMDEKKVMAPCYKDVVSPSILDFEDVEKEVYGFGKGIRPDVVGTLGDSKQIAIEILYSHKVDDEKRSRIKEQGIRCLEIDITRCPLDEAELRKFLLEMPNRRVWINHPEYEQLYLNKKKEQEEKRHELKKKSGRGERNESKLRYQQYTWNIEDDSITEQNNSKAIEQEKLKARREPVVVERPIPKPLEDGPIKDYYKNLHPHDVFKPYKAEQTVIVNFGLSYSRRAIFVIHVNKPYKGISYPFHLSRITYGDNGYEYEYIGAYATEQLAEWRYLKLKEDL